ncbi:MAG: hypothetical protein RI930_52 [Pseudomonadota bacterium]|jgi:hypothetical protein
MKRLKKVTLLCLSLILLTACETKYVSNGCVIFSDIVVLESDKEVLLENQDLLSRDFLISVKNYKDLRKKNCK